MGILSRFRRPDQPHADKSGVEASPEAKDPIDPDRPIIRSDQDDLGREPLAEAIAADLLASRGEVVAAITGPWGSGKTSVINLIKNVVEKAVMDGAKIIVIDFNAWFFSGTEQLIQHFFAEMRGKLATRNDVVLSSLGDRLEAYGARIAPFGDVPLVGDAAKALSASATLASRVAKGKARFTGSLEGQRRDVEEVLKKTPYRFLIILDDIDRLEATEIRDIVRLVRLVADFPQTIYLLAFDRKRVELALGHDDPDMGRDYLEKIVQLDYPIPPPARSDVAMLAFRAIDSGIEGIQHRDLNTSHWASVR